MKVNGDPFKTYLTDTVVDVTNRIASSMDSLPDWLTVSPALADDFNPSMAAAIDVTVVDYLGVVENSAAFAVPAKVYTALPNITASTIDGIFVATNIKLKEATDVTFRFIFDQIEKRIPLAERYWRDRVEIGKQLAGEKRTLQRQVEEHDEVGGEFETVTPVPASPIETDHVQFTVDFGEVPFTIQELFNEIMVNALVPLAILRLGQDAPDEKDAIYKVLRNFKPDPEWLTVYGQINVIVCKLDCRELPSLRESDVYVDSDRRTEMNLIHNIPEFNQDVEHRPFFTTAALSLRTDDRKVNRLIATMDHKVGPKYISRHDFIMRLLAVVQWSGGGGHRRRSTAFNTLNAGLFDKHISDGVITITENTVVSYFGYPYQSIVLPVFAELTMNNVIFNSIAVIDEFIRASKIKQNIYLRLLNTPDTCSLQNKQALKSGGEFGTRNEGDIYIKCRSQTRTEADAAAFQLIIGKLLALYNAKRHQVIHEYRNYIPDFAKQEERGGEVGKKGVGGGKRLLPTTAHATESEEEEEATTVGQGRKTLREIAPEIFFPKYSRKCIYRPDIISDAAVQELRVADPTKQVMRFPVKGEAQPRNYVCNMSPHKFPGLRENTLENAHLFPQVPCCYSKDQRNKKGSLYRKYFHGEDEGPRKKYVQEIYTSEKILPRDVVGLLPVNIKTLFSIIDTDPKYFYIRKGVTRSRLSSVECILEAKNTFVGMSGKEIADRLQLEAARLATEPFAMAAKQELFDKSVGEIIELIKTVDLRPSIFCHLLEMAYDCNIFVYKAVGDDNKGELIVPRHDIAYMKFVPTRETIFLFEHYGSESDEAGYPQCELIAKALFDKSTIHLTSFAPADDVVQRTFDVFRRLCKAYVGATPLRRLFFPALLAPYVRSQAVDMHGKCRIVNITLPGEAPTALAHDMSVFTNPLPPFARPHISKLYAITTFLPYARNELRRLGIQITGKTVVDGKITGLTVSSPTVTGYLLADIPTRSSAAATLRDVPLVRRSTAGSQRRIGPCVDRCNGVARQYREDRLTSTLIKSYGEEIFTRFMRGHEREALVDRAAVHALFLRDHVIVDKNHEYNLYGENTRSRLHDGEVPQFNPMKASFITTGEGRRRTIDSPPPLPKLYVPTDEVTRRLLFELRIEKGTVGGGGGIQHHRQSDAPISTNVSYLTDLLYMIVPKQYHLMGSQNIVRGLPALEILQGINANPPQIVTHIQPNKVDPYIYKRSAALYVAQNFSTLPSATAMIIGWRLYGYNISGWIDLTSVQDASADVDIYKYINETDITWLRGPNRPRSRGPTEFVYAYIHADAPRYTALCSFVENLKP